MQQRGRKSAAKLSVVAGTIDGRPKPPSELTNEQQQIWDRVVGSESTDFFKTASVQQQLAQYCVHLAEAQFLTELLADYKKNGPQDNFVENIDRIMKMRARETASVIQLATKLRLTNQSRYRADKVHPTPGTGGTERKLWQRKA